jgi:hypothetical protein
MMEVVYGSERVYNGRHPMSTESWDISAEKVINTYPAYVEYRVSS